MAHNSISPIQYTSKFSSRHSEIAFKQLSNDYLRVEYSLVRPVDQLDMGPIEPQKCVVTKTLGSVELQDERPCYWRLAEPFRFIEREGRLYIVRADLDRFSKLSLIVPPDETSQLTDFQPVTPFASEASVIYTGLFQPYSSYNPSIRLDVRYRFEPKEGYNFYGHGGENDQSSALAGRWQSPNDHPAFIYMGQERPISFDIADVILDPDLPDWIQSEILALVPKGVAYLSAAFEHSFERPPVIIVTSADMEESEGFSFRGLSIPGAILIRLSGKEWLQPDEKTRGLIREGVLHEIVHLWQSRLRPNGPVPAWLHEGAVEAMTGEAMVGLGLWSPADLSRDYQKAQRDCTRELAGTSLAEMELVGNRNVSYECGQMLALFSARASDAKHAVTPANDIKAPSIDRNLVLGMWRDYINQGLKEGYSLDSWYEFMEERQTSRGFSNAVKRFVQTSSLVHGPQIRYLQHLATDER